ncbi:Na(+)-translocating NADH-quinone reductase subunit C [Pseudomonas sp. F1_0610]|uniref:Na(+)-translocating NADH-quinone reductase subunit C n=1 Tax=Pseudomonas sp. F1_0610 TaxID=3114284 RepID=UPI0039C38E8C
MSSQKESTSRTIITALVMCLVCSVFVAGAAIALRPVQTENRLVDKQRSILMIAGLADASVSSAEVKKIFAERIEARIVDLDAGKFVDDKFDVQSFDALVAAKDPQLSKALTSQEDIASIKRRENYSTVYLVKTGEQLDTIVIPVRGYGLWSTMYGFMALKGDLKTVAGFGFYQQGETPGLGGEVDNPKWKAQWVGKTVYDANNAVALKVVKGGIDPAKAQTQVDGLAGATLTSNGVGHLVDFWLGENAFGKFIKNLRAGEA